MLSSNFMHWHENITDVITKDVIRWSSNVTNTYNLLWKVIIRPPRAEYSLSDLGLDRFSVNDKIFVRHDLEVVNPRGSRLQCSHFRPATDSATSSTDTPLPCVIYVHGNRSSRVESIDLLPHLLPHDVTLFCLDLSGSGMSEGEYISLGYYEEQDLQAVIEYLRQSGAVSSIGVWGRSMGAVSAIHRACKDWSLAVLVLDSPFSSFPVVAQEMVRNQAKNVPDFVLRNALKVVREEVRSRAKFDIEDLVPLNWAPHCRTPVLFAVGNNDTFVLPHHTYDLYKAWGGNERKLVTVNGGHNSCRPDWFVQEAIEFVLKKLAEAARKPAQDERESVPRTADLTAEVRARAPRPSNAFVDKLSIFRANGPFKQATLYLMAGQMGGRIESLRKVFATLDSNQDGLVTRAEIIEGLMRVGLKEIPHDLAEAIASIDADGHAVFNYVEFLAACLEREEYLQHGNCSAAFQVLDQDDDGFLTASEIEETMGAEAAASVMRATDIGSDGGISFDFFLEILGSPDTFV